MVLTNASTSLKSLTQLFAVAVGGSWSGLTGLPSWAPSVWRASPARLPPHCVPVVTAPMPPEVSRVLRSKSWISSLIAVQLNARCLSVGPLENDPSIDVVWRGPAPKIQVTLSVKPSGWHEPHEPQARLLRVGAPLARLLMALPDQRPRPVK